METLEHRRFAEFCEACTRYRYIGLCYGAPGVGKTVSAQHYANWNRMQDRWTHPGPSAAAVEEIAGGSTVLYTAPVVSAPSVIEKQIGRLRDRLHRAAIAVRRQSENAELRRLLGRLDDLRDRGKNPEGYRSQETEDAEDAYLTQRHQAMDVERLVSDPTTLVIIDEADRLKMAALEQARSIFDQGGIGMILIGMPGLEKRVARYPQFYSRIGFVHEFRPLAASEIRHLLERHWTPPGVTLPVDTIDSVAAASIIRITGGNFRLLHRLLTQVERILEINALPAVTKEVVEAARENLVIGQA
ncbi:MAG: AAA family ATPase [Nitrospira sp.]|nr:AAA family ATPase [Nitrospira sp.]